MQFTLEKKIFHSPTAQLHFHLTLCSYSHSILFAILLFSSLKSIFFFHRWVLKSLSSYCGLSKVPSYIPGGLDNQGSVSPIYVGLKAKPLTSNLITEAMTCKGPLHWVYITIILLILCDRNDN